MFGRITRDTNIGSEQVFAGDVVEVDEATFSQLKRARAIEKCDPPAGAEEPPKKPAPKFKKHSVKEKPAAE
jgi:hypothetical protein